MTTMTRDGYRSTHDTALVCRCHGKRVISSYQHIAPFTHDHRYYCPEPIPGVGYVSVEPVERGQYEARKRGQR